MDKLKYIKLENEDGSYSSSIPLAVDSDYVDVNGNTLTSELNNKATKSEVQSLASGSPLVASSTSEMIDTTRVYVNTTDGYWYYYDGDSWEQGGTYQSTTLGANAVDVENLSELLREHISAVIPTYTLDVGHYFGYDGAVPASANFMKTSSIHLEKGQTIKALVQGYRTNVGLLVEVDENGDWVRTLIRSEDSDEHNISYTATEDCYVVISTHENHFEIYGIFDKLLNTSSVINVNNLDSNLKNQIYYHSVDYTIISKKFVNAYGGISANNSFFITEPIELKKGEIIHAKLKGYQGKVSVVSTCDSSGENITPQIIPDETVLEDVSYTATFDTYVILSGDIREYYIYDINKKIVTEDEIASLNNSIKGIYKNAVFCGDSLTWGATYISDTNPRTYRNYYNYPHYVKKLMDIDTIEEYAFGGATATTWWNNYQNDISSNNCLYFVWLGTNSTFTDTVDTDCAGDDYTQYANNETGNMGRILAKISQLTNVKIVLLNCYASGGAVNLANTNKVLNDFATKFNCIKVDMYNTDIELPKYHKAYNGYYNSSHLNNAGYNRVATVVYEKLIEEYYKNCLQFEHYKLYE
jgi:hypothetical protein